MPKLLYICKVKPNKENIVTEILIELENSIERGKCLAKIVKKWQISDRTFDRHWKTANERYKETQQLIQTELANTNKDAIVERLKSAILDKNKALEILTGIAQETTKVTPNGIASAKTEQIAAIKTISELQGWNEALKTDNKTTNIIKVVRE